MAYGRWIYIYIYVKTNDFYQYLSISMVDGGATILAGWWFGTFFLFPYIGNIISPTDELIFFRGVSNQGIAAQTPPSLFRVGRYLSGCALYPRVILQFLVLCNLAFRHFGLLTVICLTDQTRFV